MLRIIVSGCNGYMGRVVTDVAAADLDVRIVAGFDIDIRQTANYPVFASPYDMLGSDDNSAYDADAVIDFSSPAALRGLLEYATTRQTPLILCTTGYSHEQIRAIEESSKQVAIFHSGNMSIGINLLVDLIKRACAVLGEGFDVEIVERHHRRKVDAPSGTALMLADAASSALPYNAEYVFDRESKRKPRDNHEIGISAVRGGTIVGVHDVIFAGQDEVIELRHTAASRDIFAVGAIRAASFIVKKPPRLYDMQDLLG